MAEDKPPAVGGDNITPGEDSTIAQMLAKAGKTLLMSFPKTFFRHSYIEQPLAFVLDKYANDLGAWPDRLPDGTLCATSGRRTTSGWADVRQSLMCQGPCACLIRPVH